MIGQIIPLREKIGNYDLSVHILHGLPIIPLREKIGNYDFLNALVIIYNIIPLREKIGNYDLSVTALTHWAYYTTTRENWELRRKASTVPDHSRLYHYERKLGTTTSSILHSPIIELYHYERKLGTTTFENDLWSEFRLYHYERKLGTTTQYSA